MIECLESGVDTSPSSARIIYRQSLLADRRVGLETTSETLAIITKAVQFPGESCRLAASRMRDNQSE
jgi:hypothetical protein